MVLGRTGGDLASGRAPALHVISRLHGISVHEHRAAARARLERFARELAGAAIVLMPLMRIELVDAAGKDRLRSGRVILYEGLLDTDGQRHLRLARQHILPGAVEGHRCGGAAALDIDHRDAFGKAPFAHQRRKAHLAADVRLAELVHAAVAEPAAVDQRAVVQPCVGQRRFIGLTRQILEAGIGSLGKGGA